MAIENNSQQRRILYVTAGSSSTKGYPDFPQADQILALPFEAVTQAALAEFAPELVVFPLFSGALDATEVLTALNGLGYRGRCLVLTQSLPRPKLIEAELRGYAGDMAVELMVIDAGKS